MKLKPLLITTLSLAGAACSGGGPAPIDAPETFERFVPPDQQTAIARSGADVTIDATGSRTFFPVQEAPRTFADRASMLEFVATKFGNVERIVNDRGELEGLRGSYTQRGDAFFENRELGVRYRVSEPVLAYVAGVRGVVSIAGEEVCMDPDGECGDGYASYLEPDGEMTAPNTADLCHNGVCVQFTSFFNKTWFPFPWARHGSNVRFTTYSALPTTHLYTSGSVVYRTGLTYPEFDSWPMPSISNQGQDSIETAVWCIGTTACIEYESEAVCGWGRVADQDVNGERRTGNGPLNSRFCPG